MPKRTDKEIFDAYMKSLGHDERKRLLGDFKFFKLQDCVDDMLGGIINGTVEPVGELSFLIQEVANLAGKMEDVKAGLIAYKAAAGEAA